MTTSNRGRRFYNRSYRYYSICVALLLSSTTSGVFSFTPAARSSSSPITSRSATSVVQRYRVENDFQPGDHHRKTQSTEDDNVFSLLPERLSLKRLDTPQEFQSHVAEETDSLVVVRFYADACPSCRATSSVFRKWSRDMGCVNGLVSSSESNIPIKIVEMPLTKATSSFLQDELQVDQIPYCHLYHPEYGLIEEQLVLNRTDLKDFCKTVETWSKGGCDFDLKGDNDCKEFC